MNAPPQIAPSAARPARGGPPERRPLRRLPLVLVVLLSLGLSPMARAQTPLSKEYKIKAGFLYNFTKFVEWPATRFASEKSPLVIGVVGKSALEQDLSAIVEGRSVEGRPVEVRLLTTASDLSRVHLLFVPAGEEPRLPATIFEEAGVLTVGESAEFARRGGIITFTLVDQKVRFEINQSHAEKAGLRISGQLLKLATVLRRSR